LLLLFFFKSDIFLKKNYNKQYIILMIKLINPTVETILRTMQDLSHSYTIESTIITLL